MAASLGFEYWLSPSTAGKEEETEGWPLGLLLHEEKFRGLDPSLAENHLLPEDIEEEKERERKSSRRGEKECDGG